MEGPSDSATADPVSGSPQDWATRTSHDLRHLAVQNGVEYQRKVNGTWKPLSKAEVVRALTAYYASPKTSEATSPRRRRQRQIMFKTDLKRTKMRTRAETSEVFYVPDGYYYYYYYYYCGTTQGPLTHASRDVRYKSPEMSTRAQTFDTNQQK